MKILTDKNFKEEIQKGVVLMDMHADWCGPCRALSPILEELDGKVEGVEFAKLDIDENPEVTRSYGVMSIPTVIIFKDGQEVKRIVGLNPKSVYLEALEAVKA
jgi:thioredoxin 1